MTDATMFYNLLYNAWQMGDIECDIMSYSGRAMYGERCIAVDLHRDCDDTEWSIAMAVAKWAVQLGHPDKLWELGKLRYRTDSLGLGMMVYWPDLKWNDETMEAQGEER